MVRPLFLCLATVMTLPGQSLDVSPGLFRTPEFREKFVGSYGFLPDVEPKVDQEEAAVIAELSELLGKAQFRPAEKRLVDFIQARKTPTEGDSHDVSPALIFTLGNLYYQNGRVRDAEQCYQIAIKRFPEYRRAHKNLATLLARGERLAEAKPHLIKAIDLGDAGHLTFGLLGHALLDEEEFLGAESAFRQAYLLNPDEKDWKVGLAQTLLAKEDWRQAAAMLQTLIDDSPEEASLWLSQANCYIQLGEVMKAAENYEVLRLKGLADAQSLNQLGDIYANQEQSLLALGAYLSAMRASDQVDVTRSLRAGRYLLQLDAPDEAERLLSELRRLAGGRLDVLEQVEVLVAEADIAVANEQLKSASGKLLEALELSPGNGPARIKLGQLLITQSEQAETEVLTRELQAEARTNLILAVSDTDSAVAYQANLKLAQLLVKNQEYLKALPRLEEAVRLKKGSKQNIEQYLRRVQRAAEAEKARKERERIERELKLEAAAEEEGA